MLNNQSFWPALTLGAACFFIVTAQAQTTGSQRLRGQQPEAVARFHLQPTGLLPATNRLHLAIGLPMRNQAALDSLLQQLYDPASPNFRKYLTPEQFAAQFGPTEEDYQALIAFAKTNGLEVTATYPNRLLLDVSGNAGTIGKVFHVTLRTYHDPVENRSFHAPDTEPSIDFSVPILHISGLDNYVIARSALIKNPMSNSPAGGAPASGSGTNGSYMGNDFRAAYAPGVALNGAGQMVGLLEFDGYLKSDITNYAQKAGLPAVPLQNVSINGFSGNPSSDDTEVCLDIEMALSMATNLAAVVVFEAGSAADFDSMLNTMAASNQIRQFSSSWGLTGSSTDPNADQTFTNMAAQGQSFFQASGDGDAWVNTIWIPAASPYVTCVGGTTLTMNGSGASYASETNWNQGYTPPAWSPNGNGYWGSGGGVSSAYTIPSWQTGINMTTNQGSTTMRNIPDVALTAANIFVVANNGQQETNVAGTSCAAPLWAGFCALVNQQAALAGSQPVGFLNPAIYAIGKGPNYAADFHDIQTGNNFSGVSPTNYPAVPGYDLCTGWGTPVGQSLITALAIADVLGIKPSSGFTANGVTGGPFDRTSQTFTLTNSSASSLNWSLINTSVWLGASSSGGTLGAGGQTTVTIGLNAAASNLLAGIYPATLTFSNWNSHFQQSLFFALQSGQSFVQNGGFETGNFYGWTLAGNGIIGGTVYNAVVSAAGPVSGGTNFIHSGTYGAFLGDVQLATLYQTVNTFPGQGYLLSFWLANPESASVQQFLVNWNTNSPGTNQIYYLTNPPVLPWTNITMVVTATGTNATLQFGAENDPDGFGLDDITLTPIPAPSFRTVAKTNNLLNFSWNSLAGIGYQLQFSTNLLKTNWVNLGAVINATNSIATTTNSIGPDPQRFYRVRWLP